VGGQDVVSIDARPANGLVYALTRSNQLYIVNTFTGVATRVGTDPVALALGAGRVGIDFNPNVDRLRVVTTADANFRYNPVNGAIVDGDAGQAGTQPDTNLTSATGNPTIVEVAYDRNFQGTGLTTLYAIDGQRNTLVTIGGIDGTPSPNLGAVLNVGNLGVDPGTNVGFDITADGTAFAAMRPANGVGPLRLYTLDLATGAATNAGMIGGGMLILDGLTELPRGEIVYAVTFTNRLISFRADQPGRPLTAVAIKGLLAGENVTDIDFRPASGELFGLTNTLRVLRIDTASGQATQLGVPIVTTPQFMANVSGGLDFNPTVDRLRLVNNVDDNLRFNPLTFAPVDSDNNPANGTTPDTDVSFDAGDVNAGQNPNVVGVAYDRNDNDPATGTTLWGIDSGRDSLVTIGGVNGTPSPNGGLGFTVGANPTGNLGVSISDLAGFDIVDQGSGGIGTALAVMQVEGELTSKLYSINLNASTSNQPQGAATLIGTVGVGELIRAMAIAPPQIQFSVVNYKVNEATGMAKITITRTGGSGAMTTALFSAFGGTAEPTSDYVPPAANTTITFNRGETTKTILIPIVNDLTAESAETVLLSLASASGGNTVLGPNSSATLTIQSNE
jgi:hypothetical protein